MKENISIKDAEKRKGISRQTITKRRNELNWIKTRIIVDAKFKKFEKKKAGRKRNG
jgi:hypothetical protein